MAFWNRQKQIASEVEVLEPIFGGSGGMSKVSFGQRTPASELAKRYGMMVHRCVTIKSQTAAKVPVRLYAIGNKTQTMKAKALCPLEVEGDTKSFLQGRMSVTPTVKAQSKLRGNMDNLTEITKHPLLDLLQDINPHTEGFSWRESVYADLDLFGSSYSAKVQSVESRPPSSLWRLQPQLTSPIPDPNTFIGGFEYGSGASKKKFQPQDILWFRTFDPMNPLGGFSPLEAWLKTVDAEQKHAAFIDWIYDNGGSPDYIVQAEDGMSTDQKKLFRREWKKMFSRLFNRRENIAIMSGKGSVTPLGRTPRDLESVAQDTLLRDKIAIAFGVPKSLITSDDVNLANAREGSVTFMRNSIMPMVQRVEDTLNEQLTEMWSDRLILIHDNPILEDRKIIIEERDSMLRSGYSIDEVREWEGRPQLGTAESTVPMIRTDVMPLDMMQNVFNPLPPAKPKSVEPKTKALEPQVDVLSHKSVLFGDQELGCNCGSKAFEEQDIPEVFIDDVNKELRKMDKDVVKMLRAADSGKAQVSAVLNSGQIEAILFGNESKAWAKGLTKANAVHLATAVNEAGVAALESVTVATPAEGTVAFNLQNTRVVDWLDDESRRIGKAATDTHRASLRRILIAGAEKGISPAGMAREMQGLMSAGESVFSKGQATRIARTESRFAQTAGKIAGWGQSTVVEGKEFLLAPEACPYCAAVDKMFEGRSLPLNKPFFKKGDELSPVGKGNVMKIDYSDLQGPPIHPHCRCTVIPTLKKKL